MDEPESQKRPPAYIFSEQRVCNREQQQESRQDLLARKNDSDKQAEVPEAICEFVAYTHLPPGIEEPNHQSERLHVVKTGADRPKQGVIASGEDSVDCTGQK